MSVGPLLQLLLPHLATTPHDNNGLSQPELRVVRGQLAALRRKGHLASHAVTFFTTRLFLPPVRVLTLRRKLRTSNSKRRCENAPSNLSFVGGAHLHRGHSHGTLKLLSIA